jgi:hypothetical protein
LIFLKSFSSFFCAVFVCVCVWVWVWVWVCDNVAEAILVKVCAHCHHTVISKLHDNITQNTHTHTQTFEMELERQLNNIMKQQLGVAIEQPPPRPHYAHDSSLPLPDKDGSDEGAQRPGSVCG